MVFDLIKHVGPTVTILTTIVVATTVVMTGIVGNKGRLNRVEDDFNSFSQKRILPEAEIRIATLEHGLIEHNRRIMDMEEFKTRGARCTATDCKRIEKRIGDVAASQTACLSSLATLIYRLDRLEMDFDSFNDK